MTGDEVTPGWVPAPAGHPDGLQQVRVWTGDIEIHISSDIAYAIWQYWRATGDDAFMVRYGAEMILDGASFWAAAPSGMTEPSVTVSRRHRPGRVSRPCGQQQLHQLPGEVAPPTRAGYLRMAA